MELQNLNENHWREVFKEYDTDGNGKLSYDEVKALIESREHGRGITNDIFRSTFHKADADRDGELDLDEFIRMVHHPKNDYTFRCLLRGYKKYVKLVVAKKEEVHEGHYEEQYQCCPPAVILLTVSVLQVAFYVADASLKADGTLIGPIGERLVYDPRWRVEIWRYVTYMFTHVTPMHLIVNLLIQLLLGVPLEMVHRHRVLAIYLAGVLAGSLCMSVLEPNFRLAGAASGVYSLMTAHIATIIMNWGVMQYPAVQMAIFGTFIFTDVCTMIYNRKLEAGVAYGAHFSGALAGFLVGITMLRGFRVARRELIFRRITGAIYICLVGAAIIWNVAYTNYYPEANKNN